MGNLNQLAAKDKIIAEKKWLAWLMKLWDVNGKRPTWIMVKKSYPEEYREILEVFSVWRMVEQKLDVARQIREQTDTQRLNDERAALELTKPGKFYTLEDYLVGLIKIQEYLGIERVPSQSELQKYARELGIPGSAAYNRKLLDRKNWLRYLRQYKQASEKEKKGVLEDIELQLREEKMRRGIKTNLAMRPGVKAWTKMECLEMLCRVQKHLNITTIPNGPQITRCKAELGLPDEKTFRNVLGPRTGWHDLMLSYLEQIELEEFLQKYNDFQTDGVICIDGLLKKVRSAMTPAEELMFSGLTEQLNIASKQMPMTCKLRFGEKDYEVIVKPLG